MRHYTLRSSFGEYSAGTEVEIIGEAEDQESKLYVVHVSGTSFDDSFDVPVDLVTERRIRTETITVPTRKERRIGAVRKQDPATGGSTQVL